MDTEVVQRLRVATAVDPYSNEPVLDWSATPAELSITTLAPAEPRPSGEPVQNARNAVTSGWTLYLPYGSDVTSRDRVRVRGVIHQILGEPADWLNAGVVVQTERVEG